MGINITRRDIEQAHATAKRALSAADKASAKGESIVGHLTQTLEVGAGALGFGVVAGRYGAVNVLGVPVDLVSAVGVHLLAFAGIAGKYDEHLHNFGDGVLSSYLTKLGAGLGTSWRIKSGASPFSSGENARMHGGMPTSHAGTLFTPGANTGTLFTPGANTGRRGPLSEAELAAMAQAYR
jgi:hypothetical protein